MHKLSFEKNIYKLPPILAPAEIAVLYTPSCAPHAMLSKENTFFKYAFVEALFDYYLILTSGNKYNY